MRSLLQQHVYRLRTPARMHARTFAGLLACVMRCCVRQLAHLCMHAPETWLSIPSSALFTACTCCLPVSCWLTLFSDACYVAGATLVNVSQTTNSLGDLPFDPDEHMDEWVRWLCSVLQAASS